MGILPSLSAPGFTRFLRDLVMRGPQSILVPLLLAIGLGAWALFREALGAEDAPAEWILLAIVILSLLPLALLLLDGLASSGGTVEVGQVKIALTAAAAARVLTVAPRNVAAGPNIGDSGSEQIIAGLERARSARMWS